MLHVINNAFLNSEAHHINAMVGWFTAAMSLGLVIGGVVLYVNFDAEDYFIEAHPRFNRNVLKVALAYAHRLGLEPLEEDECMPESTPRGGVRIYLAQRQQPAIT